MPGGSSANGRFSCTLAVLLLAGAAAAQEIPADHFPTILFDPPLPSHIRTGESVPVRGTVSGDGIVQLVLSFEPDSSTRVQTRIDFATRVIEGRFDYSFTFDRPFVGTYDLEVFTWFPDDYADPLARFSQVIVEEVSAVPREIRGFSIDPTPERIEIGRPWVIEAQPVGTDLTSFFVWLESFDGRTTRWSGVYALDGGKVRIEVPSLEPGEEGDYIFAAVAFRDGFGVIEELGTLAVQVYDPGTPEAELGVVSLSLVSGQKGWIPIINRGTASLELSTVSLEGPFGVSLPGSIPPGTMDRVAVEYEAGDDGRGGELVMATNAPRSPTLRVALTGMGLTSWLPQALGQIEADDDGRLRVAPDSLGREIVLALYSGATEGADPMPESFTISAGGPAPLAKMIAPDNIISQVTPSGEQHRRQVEAEIAARLAGRPRYPAKRTVIDYQVGDSRHFTLLFDPPVDATVMALNDLVVAFVPQRVDLDDYDLSRAQIQEHIDVFAQDMPALIDVFGVPSDVDGDGKVAILYTDEAPPDLAGWFSAESVVEVEFGGNGNRTDLFFVALDNPYGNQRTLLAHEFQHLVNFNQHVLVRRGWSEATWLNEGLSHMAEDMVEGPTSGNVRLATEYLDEPSAIGLYGEVTDRRKRGAAYLFVRSLFERQGVGVLQRLTQSGHTDAANIETATGSQFADLMALFSAQLYLNALKSASHEWFTYDEERLSLLPGPSTIEYQSGEAPVTSTIALRGVSYLRVTGNDNEDIEVSVEDPRSRLGAVVIRPPSLASLPQLTEIPTNFFADVRFDHPLLTNLVTGQEIALSGTIEDSWVHMVYFIFASVDFSIRYSILVGSGRFERSIFLPHAEAGDYELEVVLETLSGSRLAGRASVSVTQGQGEVMIPTTYFNFVRLDTPLPMRYETGQRVEVGGNLTFGSFTDLTFVVRGGDERIVQDMRVDDGRFDGVLGIDVPVGRNYILELWAWDGDWLYLGAVPEIEVGPVMTAIVDDTPLPLAFSLYQNQPNPFNARTIIQFALGKPGHASLEVYTITGQRVATLAAGWYPAGVHSVVWDGRDTHGVPLASGTYLYRLVTPAKTANRKMLLLE